jgi:integrase
MDKTGGEKIVALGKKDRERITWVKSFDSGNNWFLKLASQHGRKLGTEKNYAMALKRFCEYIGKNPDEIMKQYFADIKEDVNQGVHDWNDRLAKFVPKAIEKYGISRSRVKDHFAAIKSFFDNNAAIKLTARTPEAYSEERLPTSIDDIRDKILPHADIQETFIVLFLKDSGVSQAEALRFNVGDIEDFGNGFGYMRVFRKKEGVKYETFIGPNAMKSMQQYLDYRKREGETITPDSPLFTKKNKLGERLTQNLISSQLSKLGKKAGVELSSHRLRKTFETYLALGKVHPIILKYWMGHKVKHGRDIESRYIIPPTPKQKEAYMEAYEHIDISGQSLAELRRRQEIAEAIMDKMMSGEPLTEVDRQNIKRYDIRLREKAGRPMLLDNTDNADCPDGKNCPVFKEINEEELLTHLQDGWKVTHNLQNGRVIIQKD